MSHPEPPGPPQPVPPNAPQPGPPGVPPQLLPGQFAIQTFLKETFLTAVGGGGRTADAIHTDATTVAAWEKFSLWQYPGRKNTPENPEGFTQYAIQTETGNYLTAVDGGGMTSDVLHTDAVEALAWEMFGLIQQSPPFSMYPQYYDLTNDSPWYYAIPTNTGNYLTALGGGGQTEDPSMQTDATTIGNLEWFRLIKCGDLMSGYQHAIRPVGGYTVTAANGGGVVYNGLNLSTFENITQRPWAKFTLIAQGDGSYAMQTVSGNYVTAVGGGGIPPLNQSLPEPQPSDIFQTDATTVGAWEKFNFLDQGDGTYVIQTVLSGDFVGLTTESSQIPTFRTDITTAGEAAKFRLSPLLSES